MTDDEGPAHRPAHRSGPPPAQTPARAALIAVGLLAAAGGWVATATEPFTWHGRIATVSGAVVAIGTGLLWNRRGPPDTTAPRDRAPASYILWVVLLAATGGFQLHMFTAEPRELYPTISSLVNEFILESRQLRALLYLLWVGFGVYLLRR